MRFLAFSWFLIFKLGNFRYQKSVFQVMAEFINFEAEAEDDDEEDEFVSDDNNVNDNFIDDNDYDEPSESLYTFENVTRNAQDAINETLSYAFDSREAKN